MIWIFCFRILKIGSWNLNLYLENRKYSLFSRHLIGLYDSYMVFIWFRIRHFIRSVWFLSKLRIKMGRCHWSVWICFKDSLRFIRFDIVPFNHIELHNFWLKEVFFSFLNSQILRSLKFSFSLLLDLGTFFLDLASGLSR